ncbi:MAG: hypothetical protein EXS16_15320 [Gemmataceae bacterium]|nr:hypothetical protein [Gemmataceae bacterium]
MLRTKLFLASLVFTAFCGSYALSQNQAGKDPKVKTDDKPPKLPDIKFIDQHESFKDDLRTVRENGMKGDGPDLLEYFRKRTLKAPDPKEISDLVKKLGDEEFAVREKAFSALIGLGAAAVPGLKEGENDPDLEVRKRVADLKARIDTKSEPILQAAVARVIAKIKPEGAADVLMAFLPLATDPMVVDEISKTLGAVAVRNGTVEAVLTKALSDANPVKRGAAGEALIRASVKDELANVKKLLADEVIAVRYRICLALLELQDKDAIPVMIDLLAKMAPGDLWPIEEALHRLAGDKAPVVSLGNDDVAKKACRDAWAKWYETNAKSLDMAKLTADNVYLGYTLIVQQNNRIGAGGAVNQTEIYELDKDKKVRWKFAVPAGQPVDAQVITGNRVLLAEYLSNRVTERDQQGNIKWEFACGGNPFAVQRLANGNTFIATQGRLLEIDRNKQEVWSYQRPSPDLMRARKLPTGEVAFVTNVGTYIRMEPRTQKINQQFQVTPVQILYGTMDVLPNGNVLLGHYNQQQVKEYDKEGKQVGNILNLNWPNSVVRLPNGNNLISSYNQRQVYEYSGNNQVWNFVADGLIFVARRR